MCDPITGCVARESYSTSKKRPFRGKGGPPEKESGSGSFATTSREVTICPLKGRSGQTSNRRIFAAGAKREGGAV